MWGCPTTGETLHFGLESRMLHVKYDPSIWMIFWWFFRINTRWCPPNYKWVSSPQLFLWTLLPLIPFITNVIPHLLSGMNHQVWLNVCTYSVHGASRNDRLWLVEKLNRSFFVISHSYARPGGCWLPKFQPDIIISQDLLEGAVPLSVGM